MEIFRRRGLARELREQAIAARRTAAVAHATAVAEPPFDDGLADGEFSVSDPGTAATAVLSLCMDVARWYRPGHRRTPEEIGEGYAEAALRVVGVMTPRA